MILVASGLVLLLLVALAVSQSFRSLVARHRMGFSAALLGLVGVIVFAFVAGDYFSVDACLDGGGRWDEEQEVCQHEAQPNVPRMVLAVVETMGRMDDPSASIPERSGERSVNTPLLNGLIYLLGFIGLASIGLLPLRSWQVLRNIFRSGATHTPRKALVAFVVLLAAAALWSDVQITVRIFKCLTETYCGPSIASGWTYLAMLGVVYLAFEAIMFVLRMASGARVIVKSGVHEVDQAAA